MSVQSGKVVRRHGACVVAPSPGLRYGVAGLATLAALGVRSALDPLIGVQSPYLPFTIAVIGVARFGGRGPGFAATALSAFGVVFFSLGPRYSAGIASPKGAVGLALFACVGSAISLLIGHLRESLDTAARAEEALRRKGQLIELSHDAIVTADSKRRITGWNKGATEMYGWTEGEVTGKTIHDLLPVSSEVPPSEITEILHREGRWDGELNHTARDGRRLVVESRQVLVRDGRNETLGVLEINRDVTDRKQAREESHRASEQRRLALESARMGTWVVDVSSRQVAWDDRCANICGEPAGRKIDYDEVIARIHPDDRAAMDETVKQAIAGASTGTYDWEYRVTWPDGTVHWVASHGRILSEGDDDRRRAVQFVGVSMEITERKQAEERLRQAQKIESIGLLAGGVAHDFNNLLTVIMGSASAASDECPSCEYSQAILDASERAAYLTKQLLAYAGKGQAVVKIVDLTELVHASKELLLASTPKRASLRFNLSKDMPRVKADPSRIEQILVNLVINAGESIPPRRDGLIEIATRSCEITPAMARLHSKAYDVAAGPCACLEVRDNGDGMDEDTISRIFDPFFTTKFTGRGLGLAAVHGIVRTSNGFVEVESSPGAGATFRVFLPASDPPVPERPTDLVAPRHQYRGHSTVLVVDDEAMVRKMACATLKRCGYEVLEAANGKDALDVLANTLVRPSLALLDLAMPVMGGDEVAPILEKEYPGLKIIVSSGYPEEEARRGFASGPVAGFLQKPYTATALEEKVGECLEEQKTLGHE